MKFCDDNSSILNSAPQQTNIYTYTIAASDCIEEYG